MDLKTKQMKKLLESLQQQVIKLIFLFTYLIINIFIKTIFDLRRKNIEFSRFTLSNLKFIKIIILMHRLLYKNES